jgi:hypothetical protein
VKEKEQPDSQYSHISNIMKMLSGWHQPGKNSKKILPEIAAFVALYIEFFGKSKRLKKN